MPSIGSHQPSNGSVEGPPPRWIINVRRECACLALERWASHTALTPRKQKATDKTISITSNPLGTWFQAVCGVGLVGGEVGGEEKKSIWTVFVTFNVFKLYGLSGTSLLNSSNLAKVTQFK